MKIRAWIAVLSLWAAPALGQPTWGTDGTTPTKVNPTHVGGKDTDGSTRVIKLSTEGKVLRGDLDRDWVIVAPNVIQNVAPNCPRPGFNDSSGTIDTRGWKELALRIYARPTLNGRVLASNLGISWRGSYVASNDSSSAARWADLQNTALATPDVMADTLVYWPSSAVAAGITDSTFRKTAQAGELVLRTFHNPRGEYWWHIPMASRQGVPFTADYTSVLVRHLQSFNRHAADSTGNYGAIWNPFNVGIEVGATYCCFRVDLVGRR